MLEAAKSFPVGTEIQFGYSHIQDLYRLAEASKNGKATDYVLNMISHYPIWTQDFYDAEKISKLNIYFDKGSWTSALTDNGKDLSVAHAAGRYENDPDFFMNANPDFAVYIEGVIEKLKMQIEPKPAFIVPGSKYKEAPLSDFIDGTKSTLASYIYHLRTNQPINLKVYVGKKAPVWQRAAKKIFGSGIH